MVTIGILGANGQVGSEVCLFLSQMNDVKVVPVCRTELGSTLLRRCGLECRHGMLGEASEGARLFAGCDLVADFTLPQGGRVAEIREAIMRTVTAAMRQAPATAPFVYISSLMAFGVSPDDHKFRPRLVSRTLYGSTKRYAERLVIRLGKRLHRDVYILRLGQVHGELQSVSRSIRRKLEDETAYVPGGKSYAVFTYTVAEALRQIAAGKEKPGRYTLISAPDWSWTEVYEYYARRAGCKPDMIRFEFGANRGSGSGAIKSVARRLAQPLIQSAGRRRETITSYLLQPFPRLEQRFRAVWGKRRAQAEVSRMNAMRRQSRYLPFNVQGEVPGERLRSLSDCRTTMILPVKEVQRLLRNVVGEGMIWDSSKLPESLPRELATTVSSRSLE